MKNFKSFESHSLKFKNGDIVRIKYTKNSQPFTIVEWYSILKEYKILDNILGGHLFVNSKDIELYPDNELSEYMSNYLLKKDSEKFNL